MILDSVIIDYKRGIQTIKMGLGMDYVILLWHSLSLPHNYF